MWSQSHLGLLFLDDVNFLNYDYFFNLLINALILQQLYFLMNAGLVHVRSILLKI